MKIRSFYNKNPKKCIIIFFAALYILGVFAAFDYGMPYDSVSENNILMTNIKQFGETFLGEGKLDGVTYLSNLESIETYIERDHGKAVYYPYAIFRLLVRPDSRSTQIIMNIYTFTVNFLGMIFLYKIVNFLLKKRRYGIVASLLYIASPRILADSFYNDKDMIFASLVTVSIYFSIKIIEKPDIKTAILLGIVTAFACNTRVLGVLFPFLALILYFTSAFKNGGINKRTFIVPAVALAVFSAAFFIITPATWFGFIDYFAYTIGFSVDFSRWNGYVLFFGQLYKNSVNPLPWYYIPLMILMTTPVLISVLIFFGEFTVFKNLKKSKYLILLNVFIIISVASAIIMKSNVYNGWRHFFFIYPPLLIIACAGIKKLLENRNVRVKLAVTGIIGVQLFSSFMWVLFNHPYEFSYYNILSKGAAKSCELDYWNVSASDCLIKCAEKDGGDFSISAWDVYSENALYNATLMLPDELRGKIKRLSIKDMASADYIMINPTYFKIKDYSEDYSPVDLSGYELFACIQTDGNNLMEIYKKTGAH